MSSDQQKALELIAKMKRGETAFPVMIAVEGINTSTLPLVFGALSTARKQLNDSMQNIVKEMGKRHKNRMRDLEPP